MERRLDCREGKLFLDGNPIAEFMEDPSMVTFGVDDFETVFTRLLDIGYHPLTDYLDGVAIEVYYGKPEAQAKNLWKWLDLYNRTSKRQLIEIKKVRRLGNLPSAKDCALQWYRFFCVEEGDKADMFEVIRDIIDTSCSRFVPQEHSFDFTIEDYVDDEDDPMLAFAETVFDADIKNGFVYLHYYKDAPVLKVLDDNACRIVFEERSEPPAFGQIDVRYYSLWLRLLSKVSNANKIKNDYCYKMAKREEEE